MLNQFWKVEKEIWLFKVGVADYQNWQQTIIVTFCTFIAFCASFYLLAGWLGL